ncbi:hypothetical protein DFH11DRAFT_1634906 [Phellopilus nigrolimitatus]|nr:hypothetical protein DFH11DRAFT_1634906 [Phellopilus nigrolimitatus]
MLTLPLNIHKLRVARASGRPFGLKNPRRKLSQSTSTSTASSAEADGAASEGADADAVAAAAVESEMETLHGESWYLPSAKRRMRRRLEQAALERRRQLEREIEYQEQNQRHEQEQREHIEHIQYQEDERAWAYPIYTLPIALPSGPPPSPFLPSTTPFPPPSSLPSMLPPAPTPSSRTRPLGYMYAPRPPARVPSCRTCSSRSGSGSPAGSAAASAGHSPLHAYLPPAGVFAHPAHIYSVVPDSLQDQYAAAERAFAVQRV